jgi:hypothetical protein
MKKHDSRSKEPVNEFIVPPAYPFSGGQLLDDLRSRLAKEHGYRFGIEELGQMVGKSKSSTYFWFSLCRHSSLLGFMALLERLSPKQRQSFFESHSRQYPSLARPAVLGDLGRIEELLAQKSGLTIVTGFTDRARNCVLTALGHAWLRQFRKHRPLMGIDLHRPRDFVPVETVLYLDEDLEERRVRELMLSVWPRLLASPAWLLLFNRVWSCVPELQEDLLSMAARRHVILVEQSVPDLAALKRKVRGPIHLLRLSKARSVPKGIRAVCRCIKSAKRP